MCSIANRLCMRLCCPGNFTKNVRFLSKLTMACSYSAWSAVNILPAVLKDEKRLVQLHTAVTYVEPPTKQWYITYLLAQQRSNFQLHSVNYSNVQLQHFAVIKTKMWL